MIVYECRCYSELASREYGFLDGIKTFGSLEAAVKYGEEYVKQMASYPALASFDIDIRVVDL